MAATASLAVCGTLRGRTLEGRTLRGRTLEARTLRARTLTQRRGTERSPVASRCVPCVVASTPPPLPASPQRRQSDWRTAAGRASCARGDPSLTPCRCSSSTAKAASTCKVRRARTWMETEDRTSQPTCHERARARALWLWPPHRTDGGIALPQPWPSARLGSARGWTPRTSSSWTRPWPCWHAPRQHRTCAHCTGSHVGPVLYAPRAGARTGTDESSTQATP